MLLQTSLKLWNENYSSDFFFVNNTREIFNRSLSINSPIVFSGPQKCGKKHLAFKISDLKDSPILSLKSMSDSEIIDTYDSLRSLNKFAVFILSGELNASKDVCSRLLSLINVDFMELSQDHFLDFLLLRLQRVGLVLDKFLLKYSITRLPCSFLAVDSFINFLLSSKSISIKSLKVFFNKFDSF